MKKSINNKPPSENRVPYFSVVKADNATRTQSCSVLFRCHQEKKPESTPHRSASNVTHHFPHYSESATESNRTMGSGSERALPSTGTRRFTASKDRSVRARSILVPFRRVPRASAPTGVWRGLGLGRGWRRTFFRNARNCSALALRHKSKETHQPATTRSSISPSETSRTDSNAQRTPRT